MIEPRAEFNDSDKDKRLNLPILVPIFSRQPL